MIQNWLEKSVMMRIRYTTNRLKTLCIGVIKIACILEKCIDFRKNQTCPKAVYIKGEAVKRVETFKYLVGVEYFYSL